jgi:hypothetical protein
MSKATEIAETTHSVDIKISTWLCLVITVNCSDVIKTREVLWNWVITLSKFFFSMGKWASISKCTCVSQLVMLAKLRFVFYIRQHLPVCYRFLLCILPISFHCVIYFLFLLLFINTTLTFNISILSITGQTSERNLLSLIFLCLSCISLWSTLDLHYLFFTRFCTCCLIFSLIVVKPH